MLGQRTLKALEEKGLVNKIKKPYQFQIIGKIKNSICLAFLSAVSYLMRGIRIINVGCNPVELLMANNGTGL